MYGGYYHVPAPRPTLDSLASQVSSLDLTLKKEIESLKEEIKQIKQENQRLHNELRKFHEAQDEAQKLSAIEMNRLEGTIEDLKVKQRQLEVVTTKNAYEGRGKQSVKIQAAFRGFFARKQGTLEQLKEERRKEITERSPEVMAQLVKTGKFAEVAKLGTAVSENRLHDAMQIIRGKEEKEREFQGMKFTY